MNDLSSRQRKMVYGGCILVLLLPIIGLGAPVLKDVVPGQKNASGGLLARMRVEHDLGESTLGEIDPSSSAMNLVLLGLRGPATTVLHISAMDYQEKKDWAKLKTTVDSIIKLQPHFEEIWKFQGWNLAFNVSREWDRVTDRFYWVKEGIKFLQLGTQRNQTSTFLSYNVGDFMGRKFGNSDEKKFFRKFFVKDPDEETFDGSADPALNPDNKDNYLVAKEWFQKTNDLDLLYPIDGMTHVFARQGPARASFDFAQATQSEGKFGETNRIAWADAYDEWTYVYGNDEFLGLNDIVYKLNCTEDELKQLAERNGVTLARQRQIWNQNVKMVNFIFWQNLAECERDKLTVDAHQAIYQGKVAYAEGKTSDRNTGQDQWEASEAEQLFMEGMTGFAEVLKKYPQLASHDQYIEEGMLAVYYWRTIHQLNNKPVPEEFPLADLISRYPYRLPDVERQFQIENYRGIN